MQKRSGRFARSQKLSNQKLSPPAPTAFSLTRKNVARKHDRYFSDFCEYFLRKNPKMIRKIPRERKSSGCPSATSWGCLNRAKINVGCHVIINRLWRHLPHLLNPVKRPVMYNFYLFILKNKESTPPPGYSNLCDADTPHFGERWCTCL